MSLNLFSANPTLRELADRYDRPRCSAKPFNAEGEGPARHEWKLVVYACLGLAFGAYITVSTKPSSGSCPSAVSPMVHDLEGRQLVWQWAPEGWIAFVTLGRQQPNGRIAIEDAVMYRVDNSRPGAVAARCRGFVFDHDRREEAHVALTDDGLEITLPIVKQGKRETIFSKDIRPTLALIGFVQYIQEGRPANPRGGITWIEEDPQYEIHDWDEVGECV